MDLLVLGMNYDSLAEIYGPPVLRLNYDSHAEIDGPLGSAIEL